MNDIKMKKIEKQVLAMDDKYWKNSILCITKLESYIKEQCKKLQNLFTEIQVSYAENIKLKYDGYKQILECENDIEILELEDNIKFVIASNNEKINNIKSEFCKELDLMKEVLDRHDDIYNTKTQLKFLSELINDFSDIGNKVS